MNLSGCSFVVLNKLKSNVSTAKLLTTRAHLELSDYLMKMADVLDGQVAIEDFTNEEAHKNPKRQKIVGSRIPKK